MDRGLRDLVDTQHEVIVRIEAENKKLRDAVERINKYSGNWLKEDLFYEAISDAHRMVMEHKLHVQKGGSSE